VRTFVRGDLATPVKRTSLALIAGRVVVAAVGTAAAPSAYGDVTWMSISTMYYEVGPIGIITDGYITRIPESAFFGGGGGLASTRRAFTPDTAGVGRVVT